MRNSIYAVTALVVTTSASFAGERWMVDPDGNNVAVWCNTGGCFSQPINESKSALDTLGVWVLNEVFFEDGTFKKPVKKGPVTAYGHPFSEGGSKNFRKLVRQLQREGYKKAK